jgi:hypothetical protein
VADELRSLRLNVRTILVTTEDALVATEIADPPAASAARVRARELLERIRDRVESSGDPDVMEMYREAWRLVGYGTVVLLTMTRIAV